MPFWFRVLNSCLAADNDEPRVDTKTNKSGYLHLLDWRTYPDSQASRCDRFGPVRLVCRLVDFTFPIGWQVSEILLCAEQRLSAVV